MLGRGAARWSRLFRADPRRRPGCSGHIYAQGVARPWRPDNPIFYDFRGFYRQRDFVPLFARRVAYSAREAQLRNEASGWKSVRTFSEELTKLAAQLVSD